MIKNTGYWGASLFALFVWFYYTDEITEDYMDGTSNMHREIRNQQNTVVWKT